MSKPNRVVLDDLFEGLVRAYEDRLEKGEDHVTKDGDVIKVRASPATLKEIRTFLSEQGINSTPIPDSPVSKLADKVPFPVD